MSGVPKQLEARTGKGDVDLAQIEYEKKYTAQAFQKQVLAPVPSANSNSGMDREPDTNEESATKGALLVPKCMSASENERSIGTFSEKICF